MHEEATLTLPSRKTKHAPVRGTGRRRAKLVCLTVLYHPDFQRVGERAFLETGATSALSRHEPVFQAPGGARDERGRGLDDPFLSRRPIVLAVGREGVRLELADSPIEVVADGEPVVEARELGGADLERGVVLELSERIALLLHRRRPVADEPEERHGLLGHSEPIVRLLQEIELVADLEVPVLIRGETGTGKELAARAIHAAGPDPSRPFVAVNMGAIPASLAAAELFGSTKGAYTGADRGRPGLFHRAHGGTLFLDEIGETPAEVQVALLRALETGEIQRVGSEETQSVRVRLIAATDADLETAIREGRFREPLLHRLSVYEIHIPPLRARREDFGFLLVHFLHEALCEIRETHRLTTPTGGQPWLPLALAMALARHPWPGNVRQLRNVARQLVFSSRGREQVRIGPQLERLLDEVEDEPAAVPKRPARRAAAKHRPPSSVGDDELLAALRRNHWQLKPAAAELGISRSSLYNLVDRHPGVRKVSDLERDEIAAVWEASGHDLERAAERLEVSRNGLLQRLRKLGIR